MSQPVSASLADAMVLNLEEASVRLGDQWNARGVVLAFVRHFG